MKITILTLFPHMFDGFLTESIIGKAQTKGLVEIAFIDIRAHAKDTYGTVDDRPYGGGAGMVLRVDVLYEALKSLLGPDMVSAQDGATERKRNRVKIILTAAKGSTYSQTKAEKYAKLDHLIIIAGHYEGVDERIMTWIDDELSIGQYVLTGGELPAAIIADSVTRLLPGVLKKEGAARNESFSLVETEQSAKSAVESESTKVRKREHPHYTRPTEFMNMKVPDVLLSGDHKKIEAWRKENSR